MTGAATASVIRDSDRIVFVGDSITGQGGNGWTKLMADELAKTHPNGTPTLVALGGSGQTVGSWLNVEKQSREKAVFLDIKTNDVQSNLNVPADVLVIMLGMNDVLAPSLNGTAEGYDKWAATYRVLIATLRQRTKPRLVALATVPPCTEDAASPKNRAIAALNQRIRAIAAEEKGVVLPVHETEMEVLERGRRAHPHFHVTTDMVHPNEAGHLAIALGMLRGLGENAAATQLSAALDALVQKQAAPGFSYAIEYLPSPLLEARQNYKIRYWRMTSPTSIEPVKLTVPAAWAVSPAQLTTPSGEFIVRGAPEKLRNLLTLNSGASKTEITIPAPWLIGTSDARHGGWIEQNTKFDPEKGRLPIDDALLKGENFGKELEVAPGKLMTWHRHHATVNYTGGASPGSVDMAALRFFQALDAAYGARWIYSPNERRVQFKLGNQGFAGNDYLAVFMNGENLYGGLISKERGKVVDATLHAGWNALVFKSNHLQWQWQFSIDLVDEAANADLKFSTIPPAK